MSVRVDVWSEDKGSNTWKYGAHGFKLHFRWIVNSGY